MKIVELIRFSMFGIKMVKELCSLRGLLLSFGYGLVWRSINVRDQMCSPKKIVKKLRIWPKQKAHEVNLSFNFLYFSENLEFVVEVSYGDASLRMLSLSYVSMEEYLFVIAHETTGARFSSEV